MHRDLLSYSAVKVVVKNKPEGPRPDSGVHRQLKPLGKERNIVLYKHPIPFSFQNQNSFRSRVTS